MMLKQSINTLYSGTLLCFYSSKSLSIPIPLVKGFPPMKIYRRVVRVVQGKYFHPDQKTSMILCSGQGGQCGQG